MAECVHNMLSLFALLMTLLYTIGYIYEEQAETRLKSSDGGSYLRKYKASGHTIQKHYVRGPCPSHFWGINYFYSLPFQLPFLA